MTLNAAPLLSVIIPTHKRPQFLSRAIDSALLSAPDGDVEVLVIPNGADISWQNIAEKYQSETRVKWHAIAMAHANAARNKGLELAQGEYIRFLDDDDFLYSDKAREQLESLIVADSDVSIGNILSITIDGTILKEHIPAHKDLVEIALYPSPSSLLHQFIYKKQAVSSLKWNETVNKRQDLYWLFSVCATAELTTSRFNHYIGAWVHHNEVRASKGHSLEKTAKETTEEVKQLVEALRAQGRLTHRRRNAASVRLWRCVHEGLMYNPSYWIKIANQARKLDIAGNPATPIYSLMPFNKVPPLLIEVFSVPIRWGKVLFGHQYRN